MSIWPIQKQENTKFILSFSILCLISAISKILDSLAESMLVTLTSSGANLIPFINLWLVLPVSLAVSYAIHGFTKRYAREKIYCIVSVLGLFFFVVMVGVFCAVLPRDGTHIVKGSSSNFSFLQAYCDIYYHASIVIFYIFSELWTAVVFSVLFWDFIANYLYFDQAKRFYSLFSLDVAGLIAGLITLGVATYTEKYSATKQIDFLSLLLVSAALLCLVQLHLFKQFRVKFSAHKTSDLKTVDDEKSDSISFKSRLYFFLLAATAGCDIVYLLPKLRLSTSVVAQSSATAVSRHRGLQRLSWLCHSAYSNHRNLHRTFLF